MKSSTTAVTTMLEKFDDSKRAVANLMARENITVQVVDGLDTAKFSPELRILQIPNWTGLSTEQCDLLMSHEIGHALFTDRKLSTKKISKGLFSYLNIVEDTRIERRMKAAFPGLAPTFYKGYREFHANGPILKGTQDSLYNPKTGTSVKIASMRLIDRINLHYKIGAFATVPFTAAEKAILAKIDRATSTADCLEIAKELWEADKKPEQKEQNQNPSNTQKPKNSPKQENTDEKDESNDSDDQDASDGESQDGDKSESDDNEGDGDSTDSDENEDGDKGQGSDEGDEDEDGNDADGKGSDDSDEGDEDGDGGNAADGDSEDSDEESDDTSDSNNDSDNADNSDEGEAMGSDDAKKGSRTIEDPSADTDTEDGLKDIASTGNASQIKHLVYPVLPDSVMKDRVVPAREFAERGQEALTAGGCSAASLDALEANWNAKYLATAKHMALEFERKKNAKCLAAVKTAKSGKLDLTKLSQYRWTEDLFKRSMTVPNGKSHGVVMMIDGSGSMGSQFASVIDQTLLFAHFAFAVNIPFEAYMFSDCLDEVDGKQIGSFTCESTGLNSLTLGATGRLIGLINTTTDRAGFKKQVRVLLAMRSLYASDVASVAGSNEIPNSALGGTPLFTGMMIAERLVAKLKNDRKLDKTTFIVITDGEDTNRVWYKSNVQSDPYSYYSYNRNHQGFEALNSAFVIRDVVTKKNLSYVESSYGQVQPMHNAVLTMLLDVMKLRHDTRTVYIYLQESYGGYYRSRRGGTTTRGLDYLVRAGQLNAMRAIDHKAIAKTLTADAQYVLPATIGVADLAILLPADSVTLTEDEFGKLNTDNMTQKKIAAEFTKSMVKAVANRKFVNSVVPHLA